MASKRRWLAGAVAIAVLQFPWTNPATASLTYGGAAGEADKLSAMISKCRELSPTFEKVFRWATNDPVPMRFDLVRGDANVVEGQYQHGGTFVIDMADLETHPDVSVNANGQVQFPGNTPSHAITRCEMLAHLMAALDHNARTGHNFDITRAVGRYWQNRIRADLRQPLITHWGHTTSGNSVTFFGPNQVEIVEITNGNYTSIQWTP